MLILGTNAPLSCRNSVKSGVKDASLTPSIPSAPNGR